MPTAYINNETVGMGSLVQAGASVVRSSGYYFNTGFSNGGIDILWEDIINSDPMPRMGKQAMLCRVYINHPALDWSLLRDCL